jgi:hypothetical protein
MFAKAVGSGFSLKISNLRVKYAGLGTNDLKGSGARQVVKKSAPAVLEVVWSHLEGWAKIIGPPFSAVCVTQCAATWTFSILCSDFGISFANQVTASRSVPSGSNIGSSKRRDQDTAQLHNSSK